MQWSSRPRREMQSRFRQKPSPQTSRAGRGLQARNYPKAQASTRAEGGRTKTRTNRFKALATRQSAAK